jgi:hypothetical protein
MSSGDRRFAVAIKKYDPILYLALAVIFALSCSNAFFARRVGKDTELEVIKAGRVVAATRLGGTARTLSFGELGDFNEIEVGDSARMVSADCPGGDCLKIGAIKNPGEVIVCVPHNLIVRFSSSGKSPVDATSY